MANPSKEILSHVGQYITPDEWYELSQAVNAATNRHSYWTHPCGVPLLVRTLGICFCPLIYVAKKGNEKIRADVFASPVVQALNKKGVKVKDWNPRTKFSAGGLTIEVQ
eukprot:CAMPEP_0182472632 /NCGR_PEP_ID=MMETSP1319-20130603/22522_1 /TAXON_ID=172717 /ORGANISM="Bolidomonas pacifica, Strain RCC208" /LENGTH=108 /DNA_ID=CAMNT_0024673349 /DNA_START=94 /DNA_END=417 /DNA_ORIENTATION=-